MNTQVFFLQNRLRTKWIKAESMEINHFCAPSGTEAIEIVLKTNFTDTQTLQNVFSILILTKVCLQAQAVTKYKGLSLMLDPLRKILA